TTFVPLPPGQHTVRCYVPYIFFSTMGDNSVVVDVTPGQVVGVTWQAPWLAFLMGKMTVTGVAAPPAAAPASGPAPSAAPSPPPATASATPAGWHPDPRGRHELRYWDGNAWTEHVSDAGKTGTDNV